jgi:hypothetical protein
MAVGRPGKLLEEVLHAAEPPHSTKLENGL